jgi:hypothetical protein
MAGATWWQWRRRSSHGGPPQTNGGPGLWCFYYRKLRLCLGFQTLPRAFYRALGKENLCGEPRSAQQHSRHCILCRGSGRRQAWTLGIIKSLPRASPRHGVHRQRRSESRHIWAAVHCADGSTVRLSAQMQPMPSAPSPALGKGIVPGLPRLTGLCREPAGAIRRAHICANGPLSAHAPLPRAPPGSRQRSNFFSFWVELFSLLKVH